HILQLLRQGSSLGGARPKCTVKWKEQLWIAKFPAKGDSVDVPNIEYATMKLAGKCGVEVPEMELRSIAGKNVFLIKRFDRLSSPEGWLRTGFISSLSLTRLDERDRLKWSYLSIADLMRKYCPAKDIRQFYRRMIFNILVRNTDDHPRNHGFLVHGNELRLSPAYDLVPTMTRHGVGTTFDLAMRVGEYGRAATINNALTRCGRFGLSDAEAKEIIDEMIETTRHWKELFERDGLNDKTIKLLEPSFGETV
ncbi:MAG: HipA domain-containing protein, partial [Kiritimatiellaeota bacterium]|nr:HipA domain-containing protein [Kiritimatiellota bacterium]